MIERPPLGRDRAGRSRRSLAALGIAVIMFAGLAGCGDDSEPRAGDGTVDRVATTDPVTTTDPSTDAVTTTGPPDGNHDVAPGGAADPDGAGGDDPSEQATAVRPEGFDTASLRYRRSDGTSEVIEVWTALNGDQRRRGLMGVTDLGEPKGMMFVFDGPGSGGFWMRDTVMPLSIAFFDGDGAFVSATDMEPCLDMGDRCPNYPPAGPYVYALEVPVGGLADLGIGTDASMRRLVGTSGVLFPSS